MNVQQSQIQQLILYKFEQGYNTMEMTKKICCAKCDDAIEHSAVTRWLMKFGTGCKTFGYQARWSRSKTVDSEAVF